MVLKHFVELTVKSSIVVHNWPPWKTRKTELCCPIIKKKEKISLCFFLFVWLASLHRSQLPYRTVFAHHCYSDNSCAKKSPFNFEILRFAEWLGVPPVESRSTSVLLFCRFVAVSPSSVSSFPFTLNYTTVTLLLIWYASYFTVSVLIVFFSSVMFCW